MLNLGACPFCSGNWNFASRKSIYCGGKQLISLTNKRLTLHNLLFKVLLLEVFMTTISSSACTDVKNLVKDLTRHCRNYKGADTKRALIQLVVTLGLFTASCTFMIWGVTAGVYWPLALILPTGGLLVRMFIIQHDCGHRSFFRSAWANDMVGRLLSVFTMTPYGFWRQAHNMHHAGSGNLDRRGIGSIDTLTVDEYKQLPRRKKFFYRLYRNPFVLLVLGTPLYVLLFQRFPHSQGSPFFDSYQTLSVSRAWKSIMGLNLAVVGGYGLLGTLLGWNVILLVFLPAIVIASWIGGWLFFIQHQFEATYWQNGTSWDFHEASVLGSSYYALPPVLQWFTGNIGLHHIHHLCSAIPNYRLQECLKASDSLQSLNRLTLTESLQCLRWGLWDEKSGKMVSIRQAA